MGSNNGATVEPVLLALALLALAATVLCFVLGWLGRQTARLTRLEQQLAELKQQPTAPPTPATAVAYQLPGSGAPPRALASKLSQETISVCDFGAVPNSPSDQTVALQKGEGKYLTTSTYQPPPSCVLARVRASCARLLGHSVR
jgi:HAMP domain-containing protein